jgi:hypothetical protein
MARPRSTCRINSTWGGSSSEVLSEVKCQGNFRLGIQPTLITTINSVSPIGSQAEGFASYYGTYRYLDRAGKRLTPTRALQETVTIHPAITTDRGLPSSSNRHHILLLRSSSETIDFRPTLTRSKYAPCLYIVVLGLLSLCHISGACESRV